MTARLLRLPVLAAAALITGGLTPAARLTADPPADMLPKGAKARLGTPRMRDSTGWTGAALTPDGKFLVTHTPEGLTKFDATTGEKAGTIGPKMMGGFGGGFGAGGRIEFSADGKRGLTIGYSAANVWEAASGKPLTEVKRPMPYGEGAAALSADGKVLAVGANKDFNAKDKPITALVWDVEKNEKRAEVTVLQNQAVSVALSPDGKLLATWGTHYEPNPPKDKEGPDPNDPNRLVQFWDAVAGKELAKVRTDGYGPAHVVFASDGQTAAIGHGSGTIRLIDPKTGAEKRRLFGRGDQGGRLAFSPDGKTLATGGTDGAVQLWGVADGARVGTTDCPAGPVGVGVRGIVFTAPDRAVTWTGLGATAIVWEVPSGKLLSPLGGHVAPVRSVAFATDGKAILTGGEDGRILRWDSSGKQLGEVTLRGSGSFGPQGRFQMGSVILTPDGKLAVAQMNSVYDAATGRQVAAPGNAPGADTRAALCGDARTLLLVPNIPFQAKEKPTSLKVGVWDLATGAKSCEIDLPVGDLLAAAVTPDRSKLVTAVNTRPADTTKDKPAFQVTGWELATGKKLGTLSESGGFGAAHLTLAPDNTTALVATPEGKLLAVDVAAGKTTKEIDTNNGRLTAAPAFTPDGKRFAAPISSGFGPVTPTAVRVYDLGSGRSTAEFRGPTPVTCLAFSPDGKTLATGGLDTTVLLWDATAGGQ